MRKTVAKLSHRHLPSPKPASIAVATIGATLGIGLLGWLGALSALKLLVAPMGASSVLLFSVPASPLSQPANVVLSHILAAMAGLAVGMVLPGSFAGAGLAVGLSIAAMMAVRVTHPPAGAMALVAWSVAADKPAFLASVILASLLLVASALIWHRITGAAYPIKPSGT